MNEQKINWRVVLAVALIAWLVAGRPGCNSTDDRPDVSKVIAVGWMTDVEVPVPLDIRAALRDINERKMGVQAETVSVGNVPDLFAKAMDMAQAEGLPCLATVRADASVEIHKGIETTEQVFTAAGITK